MTIPFTLPAGGSDPMDLGEGIMLVGYERELTDVIADVATALKTQGWAVETTGGDHMGGMWIVQASKDGVEWSVTGQGLEGSCQLSITRLE